MSLFRKAEERKMAVKVLGYGATNSGKSTFGLSFPKIVAIDTEDGLAHYEGNPNLKYVLTSSSAEEVEEGIEEIEDELIDEVETFMLDSETKVYENQQHSALNLAEKRASRKGQNSEDANLSQREWGKIKMVAKRIKAGQIRLSSKGLNVVSIAQEKPIKQKQGENWITVGYAPDAPKGIEYDFDIVLRFYTEESPVDGSIKYFAKVDKDRTGVYKKGAIIENPSYENWKEYFESKSGGKSVQVDFAKDIEKDEVGMKTEAEIAEEIKNEFAELFKGLDDEAKVKVKGLLTASKVDPTNAGDADKLAKINEAMRKM